MSWELTHVTEREGGMKPLQNSPGPLPPRRVLDMHADLQRSLQNLDPVMRQAFTSYALKDAAVASWAASHLHPARTKSDLSPWLNSLGTDLIAATTYQVTTEMIDLAEALSANNPELGDITPEDLPSDWGFMWLDRPVDRPSIEDGDEEPLQMHAVSWAIAGTITVQINSKGGGAYNLPGETYTAEVPCLRIREWGYSDHPSVIPKPLHLMGQSTVILNPGVLTPMTELHLVHMIWILMGMEIVASRRHQPENRMARKRAASLTHHDVHVITLRRPKHIEPEGDHRHVDWTCTWVVRGHWRYPSCDRCGQRHQACLASDDCAGYLLPDGKDRTWIKPYLKGPEGAPLRAADLLYKLAR